MSNAYVLYVDHQGHPAPLTECFHATASRHLSSTIEDRFPPSTVTEVDSAYCPQCLSFHDAASAARLGFCPKATCQRCPVCVSAVASIHAADNVCYYQCGQCDWTSRECHLTIPMEGDVIGKLELARAAEDLGAELSRRRTQEPNRLLDDYFSTLTAAWENHSKLKSRDYPSRRLGSVKDTASQEAWSVEALEASLENKRKQNYEFSTDDDDDDDSSAQQGLVLHRPNLNDETTLPSPDPSMSALSIHCLQWQALGSPFVVRRREDLLPLPMPLRVRHSRRCRAELAQGRPGILLKPKLNPLEGDSSLRSGHGQWWKKDSSAIHVIPRVKIMRQHGPSTGAVCLLVRVSNPTLGLVRLRFAASPYTGESEWDDDDDDTKRQTTTTSLPHLLVDTLTQEELHVELDTTALGALASTEIVELQSAEDSIMELGNAGKIPESVQQWCVSSEVTGGEAKMSLVAQRASVAWFELVVPELVAPPNTAIGLPLQLQVQIGNGSWESSLIQPKAVAEDEKDWAKFDLVLTLN